MAQLIKALVLATTLLLMNTGLASAEPVVVSSKLSTESAMLGQMIRLLLESHGIPTGDRMTLGATPVVRKALLTGEKSISTSSTPGMPASSSTVRPIPSGRTSRLATD